jgi:L-threonylcarbamoyladenylate synthase
MIASHSALRKQTMYLNKALIKKIQNILDNDGVIAFPTDTVWGLGCLPDSQLAVKKIYEIKKREAKKPLILMSDKIGNFLPYVTTFNKTAKELIKNHFPGALTLVTEKSIKTPDFITSNFNTVGIRIPDNDVFKEICENIKGHVLATTSANLSGQPSAKTYQQAIENMKDKADLIIEDFGQSAKGIESTVVFVSADEIKILRQGAVKL